MMIAVSAETMRELDRIASESGISTLSLMENAGRAVARKVKEVLSTPSKGRIVFFCGKGNNGGDGFVAARRLIDSGFVVDVYLLGKKQDVKNEAAANLGLLLKMKDVKEIASSEDIKMLGVDFRYSLIIDSIVGTGFSGPVKGILRELVDFINNAGVPILAVDVPSGLNANTGNAEPTAVRANWTITFGLPKKGFYAETGPLSAGIIEVVNIGFPKELLSKAITFEKKYERTAS